MKSLLFLFSDWYSVESIFQFPQWKVLAISYVFVGCREVHNCDLSFHLISNSCSAGTHVFLIILLVSFLKNVRLSHFVHTDTETDVVV